MLKTLFKKIQSWLLSLLRIKVAVTETDRIIIELEQAKQRYFEALEAFNYVNKEFIDVAIAEIDAAQKKYSALLRHYSSGMAR